MNGLDYLDQISHKAKPTRASGGAGGLSPKLMKIASGLIGALVLILVIGIIIVQVRGSSTEDLKRLDVKMGNLFTVVGTYNKHVKSTNLRSIGLSLTGSLTDTLRDLDAYLDEEHHFERSKVGGSLKTEEEEHYKKLDETLLNGKLNGILDQVYIREMRLELSLILSLESQILKNVRDDKVKEILTKSQGDLTTIYEQFVAIAERTQ